MSEDRTKFLGGSDGPAVLGIDPRRSPVDVWMEKTGRSNGQVKTEAMERGTALEPYLVDVAERVVGMKVVERNLRVVHHLAPHVQAQLDGKFEDGTLLEIKTAAKDDGWGDGPDAVPEHYRCQNQQQMLVAKAPKTIVFAAIGAAALKMSMLAIEHAGEAAKEIVGKVWEKEGRVYTVHGEEAFQSMLYFRLDGFWWDHVVADVPPVATSIEDVRKLWPEQSTRIVMADEEILTWLRTRNQAFSNEEAGKKAKQEADDWLAGRMQDARAIIDPATKEMLYTLVQRKGYMSPAHEVKATRVPCVRKHGKEIR